MEPLRQVIVVRRDLLAQLGWPLGSVIAQACHASTAALFAFAQDDAVRQYTHPDNLPTMHKVVLEVESEAQLTKLAEALRDQKLDHVCWREQPENILTALATKPYTKTAVGDVFKRCRLFK